MKTRCALQWRHNDHDGVSNNQPHGCLLKPLFRRRSKKTSKLRVTGLWVGNSPGPVNSPHKGPVTRKMFPFDDVITDSNDLNQINAVSICMFIRFKVRFSTQKIGKSKWRPYIFCSSGDKLKQFQMYRMYNNYFFILAQFRCNKTTTSRAPTGENFVKMTFLFRCLITLFNHPGFSKSSAFWRAFSLIRRGSAHGCELIRREDA